MTAIHGMMGKKREFCKVGCASFSIVMLNEWLNATVQVNTKNMCIVVAT